MKAENSAAQACACFQQLTDKPEVWDIFIFTYVKVSILIEKKFNFNIIWWI